MQLQVLLQRHALITSTQTHRAFGCPPTHCHQAASWHLAAIEVANAASGARWLFPCHAWLGAGRGAGREQRELAAAGVGAPSQVDDDEPWELTVTTSDMPGAGLTADGVMGGGVAVPRVSLLGPNFGETAGPFALDAAAAAAALEGRGGASSSEGGTPFVRGQTAAFVLDVRKGALGHGPQQLTVSHAGNANLQLW